MTPDPHLDPGLTDALARERLARDGPNRMPQRPGMQAAVAMLCAALLAAYRLHRALAEVGPETSP